MRLPSSSGRCNRSNDRSFYARLGRLLLTAAKLNLSPGAVDRAIRKLQARIDRAPRNAVLVPLPDRLRIIGERRGVAVAADLLHRAHFTLRLYHRLRLVRSYPIADGRVGVQTPAASTESMARS